MKIDDIIDNIEAIVITPSEHGTKWKYYIEHLQQYDKVLNPIWKRESYEHGLLVKDAYGEDADRSSYEEDYINYEKSTLNAEEIIMDVLMKWKKHILFSIK